jgi:uncharacterized membrane protein (UPF0127 family)
VVIKNLSKNIVISTKAKLADSFTDRFLGLLNPRNPRFLIFHTRFGLHTFFMKKSIDVALLNEDQTVIKIKTDLAPDRFFLYHPRYSTVIEMPSGSIKKYHLAINDKISIE